MSRLTRDGTAQPNSRNQTLRRERGQGKSSFPCSADHEQDWQPYPVDAQSAKSDDHTHTTRLILAKEVGEGDIYLLILFLVLYHRQEAKFEYIGKPGTYNKRWVGNNKPVLFLSLKYGGIILE